MGSSSPQGFCAIGSPSSNVALPGTLSSKYDLNAAAKTWQLVDGWIEVRSHGIPILSWPIYLTDGVPTGPVHMNVAGKMPPTRAS